METTFDKFITNNAKQKALFDKEYAEFSCSESALENLDKERQTKPVVVKSKARHKKYITVQFQIKWLKEAGFSVFDEVSVMVEK